MSDINKSDIKLMQSQRLDDTDQGGGQMTSVAVQDGKINNLFPDISRLDRVYGRVSLRKAYLAVQTGSRETYYGSHTILTEQTKDPNVGVCFFSSEDWFDTREDASDRIEAYLVRGPRYQGNLWGPHYKGTSHISMFTGVTWPAPEIGDTLVFTDIESENDQYVRVIDVETEIRTFTDSQGNSFQKKIITMEIGAQLEYDLIGEEPSIADSYSTIVGTEILTTVVADASRYYGVSALKEAVSVGDLSIRVSDVQNALVPSAASETAIVDAGAGTSASPLIQTRNDSYTVTRSMLYSISSNTKLYIGESIKPGSLSWSGGISFVDNSQGDVLIGTTIIGTISYTTGVITFSDLVSGYGGTGTATYIPACPINEFSQTGLIGVEVNNRGFVYTYSCNPLPSSESVKVEYLAGGKWYSMWDVGGGRLRGSDDFVGSGTVNKLTGSISMTLGSMPDVGSQIIIYWSKVTQYYDLSGETIPLKYRFSTTDEAVARNTFSISWNGDLSSAYDDGNGKLLYAHRAVDTDSWIETSVDVGIIKYATGQIELSPSSSFPTPSSLEVFSVKYNYGDPEEQSFFAPARSGVNKIPLKLLNTPIVPGSLSIEWKNNIAEYDATKTLETTVHMYSRFENSTDPGDGGSSTGSSVTYRFNDDGAGFFDSGSGTVDYSNGDIVFSPDRETIYSKPKLSWSETGTGKSSITWYKYKLLTTYSRVYDGVQTKTTSSLFPASGSVTCKYYSNDGTNQREYDVTLSPMFLLNQDQYGISIIPSSLSVRFGSKQLIDNGDGGLFYHTNGESGDMLKVGTINYLGKFFEITNSEIDISNAVVDFCSGTADIEPIQSVVFRTPGSPIRPGSLTVRATTGTGRVIEATSDFSGEMTGDGVVGIIDFTTGICNVMFGEWVEDNESSQAEEWYNGNVNDGAGNVWMPYIVFASTILVNCVITSYLPLDPDLLGLDPVRLPMDGKVPIFRDGYIISIHHTKTYTLEDLSVQRNNPYSVGRENLDLMEVYDTPDDAVDGNEYSSDFPEYVPEIASNGDINYMVDLTTGNVMFTSEFDASQYKQPFKILHRVEDMALASDVQVTGHISITTPLTHDYPTEDTDPDGVGALVSSVLPSGDLQSRAYNEFEQVAFTEFSDKVGDPPLASYNFVDYPITVYNTPSINERWLILFRGTDRVDVIGENFGVMTSTPALIKNIASVVWDGSSSGSFLVPTVQEDGSIVNAPTLIIANKRFSGGYYWKMNLDGFGAGWQTGNCIRFNQDAANFPLWFVRTTLQAPATEQVDHYTIQIRGDSS